MEYSKLIDKTIYEGIERTFLALIDVPCDDISVQAEIMAVVLRRQISDYIDSVVKNVKE